MGYVKNHEARRLMCCMDSLLMPYQNKVSGREIVIHLDGCVYSNEDV